ncbi:ribonuclease H-like domain-containing protein [Tanacetum coccineum]
MYTIVWRNRDDLDTMSLDDLYNHLKVYEPEVQKKAGSNSQNMAFISSSNTSSRKGEVPTASIPTASSQVSTVSTEVAAASLSHDTICAYIKKTGKKITIQGSDVAGFDKSKVECFNCHKMGYFARECRAPRSQDRGKRESYKKDPTEFTLMAMSSSSSSSDNEMGLPEFIDDTVTDYSRPIPSVDVSKDVSASSLKQGGSFDNVVSKPMTRNKNTFSGGLG